jgi:fumagillin biosynthesis cytochrome P450 monooxygenase
MISPFVSLGLLLLLSLVYCLHKPRAALNLPPGPRPLPIVGSPSHLPSSCEPEYKHWLKFKDLYGPVSSLTVLGRTMIILHDKQAVDFLLGKNSTSTSDRPVQPFADLCGFGVFLSSLQYGPIYRRCRDMIRRQMGSSTAKAARWATVQDDESRRLLLRALAAPDDLIGHFKT